MIYLEANKIAEIKILTEDAERLERCSEELGMDPSEIIHRLLDWHEQFMSCNVN